MSSLPVNSYGVKPTLRSKHIDLNCGSGIYLFLNLTHNFVALYSFERWYTVDNSIF
jgi:hypothetical protein